eukprot:g17989.t1
MAPRRRSGPASCVVLSEAFGKALLALGIIAFTGHFILQPLLAYVKRSNSSEAERANPAPRGRPSQEKWSQSYTCELCMEDRQLRLSVLSCTRRGVFIDSVETAPEVRQKLLPKIISGTSGGAAIAAYICCRTDDELLGDCKGEAYPLRLNPDEVQPSITLWAGSWLERVRHYIKFGCVFPREPIERWAEILWLKEQTTFLEAFKRTGRVLNITCSIVAGDSGEQVPLLLNYQTHSHVLIASAVICSGSMPGLLNPSKLLEKCPESGLIRAHCERQTCYADGSIDFDIPSLTLAQDSRVGCTMWGKTRAEHARSKAFGVRYTVAVQVNPHVTPFNFAPHGEAGRPISWSSPSGRGRWRGGFILCALEVVLKESFRSAWKVMGLLQLLPRYFGCSVHDTSLNPLLASINAQIEPSMELRLGVPQLLSLRTTTTTTDVFIIEDVFEDTETQDQSNLAMILVISAVSVLGTAVLCRVCLFRRQRLREERQEAAVSDEYTGSAALNSCGQQSWSSAMQILEMIQEWRARLDLVSCTEAINACAKSAQWLRSTLLWQDMEETNEFCFSATVKAYEKAAWGSAGRYCRGLKGRKSDIAQANELRNSVLSHLHLACKPFSVAIYRRSEYVLEHIT